ncbi:hypothetical protein HN992_01600 [Candidatus Woesearchaeota archaeon]|jgi:hypothetical protein|nr:hypothetical protein [Candidatus Woesearchaeota archaeon]MBT3438633.1 hypothetical protein [Candidatus Woesearchaeota archaeon]MBT4058469.1 hypothetical protein [Candidatus Woesearchaeota archaeon]MBT4207318.1 hypothetical protein [Candidatus Woesearchaeota archaeon]MBT4730975.1 hypothetical protein [Candidatus Woesearchaeota archaeon]
MVSYKKKNLVIGASVLGLCAAISPCYLNKDTTIIKLDVPQATLNEYSSILAEPSILKRKDLIVSPTLEEKIEDLQEKPQTDEDYVLSLFEQGSGSPFSLYSPEDIQQLPRRELFTNIYSSMMGDLNELTVKDLIERLPKDHPFLVENRNKLEGILGTSIEGAQYLSDEELNKPFYDLADVPSKEQVDSYWNKDTLKNFTEIRETDLYTSKIENFYSREAFRTRENASGLDAPKYLEEDLARIMPYLEGDLIRSRGYEKINPLIREYGDSCINELEGNLTEGRASEEIMAEIYGVFQERKLNLENNIGDENFQFYVNLHRALDY